MSIDQDKNNSWPRVPHTASTAVQLYSCRILLARALHVVHVVHVPVEHLIVLDLHVDLHVDLDLLYM